jgi:shikimate dehydrogenase
LTIANRTVFKARDLAARAASLGSVEGCSFGELAARVFDLVINATSAGLAGELPDIPPCLAAGGWTYDLSYASRPTPFCRWGAAQGAVRALDGLGMLVEQAAESFLLWRGVRPQTGPVIEALRAVD